MSERQKERERSIPKINRGIVRIWKQENNEKKWVSEIDLHIYKERTIKRKKVRKEKHNEKQGEGKKMRKGSLG